MPSSSIVRVELRKDDTRGVPHYASPTGWAEARGELAAALVYWLSTVRPDGRPHITPLIGVWQDGALYFCTDPEERKVKTSRTTRTASAACTA